VYVARRLGADRAHEHVPGQSQITAGPAVAVKVRMSTVDALNMQAIAEPAVATAVGCVALIAAVPVTTGLAAALVARMPADQLPDAHAHAH
jgi:hypothetical protein